jgi:hypothetical protein
MSVQSSTLVSDGWLPQFLSTLVVTAFLTCIGSQTMAVAEQAPAPPLPAAPASQTIKGDILNIEGEHVVVKDISGHEIELRVSKDTRMDRLKVGDKVNATVAADGHAESVEIQTPPTSR